MNNLVNNNSINQGIKTALLSLKVSGRFDDLKKSLSHEDNSSVHRIIEPVKKEEILAELFEKIEKVDFRTKACIDEKESLKASHYQIIVVEIVLEVARNNGWNFCQVDGFLYLFNGVYWEVVTEKEMESFLGKAAEKMGINKCRARYYLFKEQLLKQFISATNNIKRLQLADSVLINLQNGSLEISASGVNLRGFNMDYFITYQLPFKYDENAKAPIFQAYLDKVIPDKKTQMVLAEYCGYIFVSHHYLKLEKVLLLYGPGANGKSVFFEVINALLGSHNVSYYSLQSLTNENGYFRAQIANKLVNYASEINGKIETSVFKQLASGEPVEARLPYKEPFIIKDYAKLIFNCNELPRDIEHTPAFYRRFLIIPFEVIIPEEEQDKELSKKIIENELSGVLNWIISGLKRIINQKGFTQSDEIASAIKKYEMESDSVRLFLDENGYQKDAHSWEILKNLYIEYRSFCIQDGYRHLNKTNFRKRLQILGYTMERRNNGLIIYMSKKREA